MPLARIDVPSTLSSSDRAIVGEVVYDALRQTLNVPEGDRFQVIAAHGTGDLVIDSDYLGITRTSAAILVQVTLNEGRSVEAKKAFFRAVADGLNSKIALRREDVIISLVETKKENWSFGCGEAQYA